MRDIFFLQNKSFAFKSGPGNIVGAECAVSFRNRIGIVKGIEVVEEKKWSGRG